VGYFNLRGWKAIADDIDGWPGGDDACCRVLVGMQVPPSDKAVFRSFLDGLGYDYVDESANPAYRLFLGG
jgi:hypothetical protein